MRAFRMVVWAAVGGTALGATFLIGRSSVRATRAEHPPPATAPEIAECPGTAQMKALQKFIRNLPPPPVPVSSQAAGEDPAIAEARATHAHALLGDVFGKLEQQAKLGSVYAETRSSSVIPYLDGLLHGAIAVDPGIRETFSQEFTTQLCERELADDQATTMAHMAMMLPDITTTRGVDCYLKRAKEGVPFWTMLDAWRRSGLPSTPTLDKIRASATDERTIRRFLTAEQVYAQLGGPNGSPESESKTSAK